MLELANESVRKLTLLCFSLGFSGVRHWSYGDAAVRLSITANQVTVSAQSTEIGDSSVTIPVNAYSGPEMALGLNPNFLLEFIRKQPADRRDMYLNDPQTPVHITPAETETRPPAFRLIYTVMPLALGA